MTSFQNLRDLCCDCPTGTCHKLLNLYRDKKVQIYKEKSIIVMNLIIRDNLVISILVSISLYHFPYIYINKTIHVIAVLQPAL